MSSALLSLLLVVLVGMCALNAFLTLRLASRLRAGTWPPPRPSGLETGSALPAFVGRRLADGTRVSTAELAGAPMVIVFLAAGCPKCAEVKPTLIALLPAMMREGVRLLVVSMEPAIDSQDALGQEPLRDLVVLARAKDRGRLNPANLVPYFIFVDDTGMVVASGLVGQPDWLSFVEQMELENQGDLPHT